MNTNLLDVIKQIIADHGEAILADSKRVNAYLSDMAAKEPKPQRMAFIKCLMYGFYTELKNTPVNERQRCKTRLAQRLHDEEGTDATLCADSVDLLEAVLFGTVTEAPKPTPPVQAPPETSATIIPAPPQPMEPTPTPLSDQTVAARTKKDSISEKPLLFVIQCGFSMSLICLIVFAIICAIAGVEFEIEMIIKTAIGGALMGAIGPALMYWLGR